MSFDFGKAQIDTVLLSTLMAAGVRESDGKELARMDVFGGTDAQCWLAGLRAASTFLNSGSIQLDWGTLPRPWETVCPTLAAANGRGPAQALLDSIEAYESTIQNALISAIGAVAQETEDAASKHRSTKPTGTIDATAVQKTGLCMAPVDPKLVARVQKILHTNGTPKEQRRKKAGEQIIEWLLDHGRFIKTTYGQSYYLFRGTHKLYTLDTYAWYAWLYTQTGANPSSKDFQYFQSDCLTAAESGERMEVVKVAHWDAEQQILRVSRFDGLVFRLDGLTIETETNGDGPILFDDPNHWVAYNPDYTAKGAVLDWSMRDLAHWDGDKDELSLLLRGWWLSTMFTELCPTRPILVMKGEKGSGKSMTLRMLLRFLLGPAVDVMGVPDRADALVAATSNNHIAVFDNMDEPSREIRDKLASLSTGKTDELRKLYTTNESVTIRYRCWLACTARTPDTLQRDDLVDRVLIVPVRRIGDSERSRESKFLAETIEKRNQWWGDFLSALNLIVAEIRRAGLPDRSGLRMEDWAALGTVISRTLDQADTWEKSLKGVRTRQAEFLLEDDSVVQGIEAWLASSYYYQQSLATRDLYSQVVTVLFGGGRPDASWPRSVKSFGRHLVGVRRELQVRLQEQGYSMSWWESGTRTYYQILKAP